MPVYILKILFLLLTFQFYYIASLMSLKFSTYKKEIWVHYKLINKFSR